MLYKGYRTLPHFMLKVICCVIIILLVGCRAEFQIENTENQSSPIESEATSNKNTEDNDATFHIDLTKISPMILQKK